MPNRKNSRLPPVQSKALLLPMARDRASDLVLRSRLLLERIRRDDIDRMAINHMAQVCIICGYVARAGHSHLPQERIQEIGQQLHQALLVFDETGKADRLPGQVVEGLIDVVNEYDRLLRTVRLELFVKASDYLDHLMAPPAA